MILVKLNVISKFITIACWTSAVLLLLQYGLQIVCASAAKHSAIDKVNVSKGVVKREMEISKVPKLNVKSSFCTLPASAIDDICRSCIEVHQSVYNKFTYTFQKDITAGDCELQTADMGEKIGKAAEVYVRRCSVEPKLYISQGNKPGWVLVFTPSGPQGQLEFAVHLGPFDNKRFFSGVWSRIKSLIPF